MANKPLRSYPLKHRYEGYFSLNGEDATKDSTILPIFFADQGKGDPTTILTNPRNDSFVGNDSGPSCYMDSVINRIHVKLSVVMPPAGQETGVHSLLYQAGMVCLALDDVDTVSEDGSYTIPNTLKLQREASNEDTIQVNWSGTDLDDSTTLPTAVEGLTTDQTHESISFNDTGLDDASQQALMSGKLKDILYPTGRLTDYIIKKEVPYIADFWTKVRGKVKRMNKGTFCGLIFNLPQGTKNFYLSDETTNVTHIRFRYVIEFNEYNDNFNSES